MTRRVMSLHMLVLLRVHRIRHLLPQPLIPTRRHPANRIIRVPLRLVADGLGLVGLDSVLDLIPEGGSGRIGGVLGGEKVVGGLVLAGDVGGKAGGGGFRIGSA